MVQGRNLIPILVLAPVLTLAVFQGMVTAGLLPLAVFGPVYAVARALSREPGPARAAGARVTAAATVGAGLALAPALTLLTLGPDPMPLRFATLGLMLLGAGLGGLAGLATTPPARPLSELGTRRWLVTEAIDKEHGQGLALLFLAALPAGTLLGLLREADVLATFGGSPGTIPEALFGMRVLGGYLVLPSATAAFAIAIPLTLAPLAIGFLTPMRASLPLAAGSLAALLLLPLAVLFDLPVPTPGGAIVPLSLRPSPGLDALVALAPAGAGALLGAGVVAVSPKLRETRFVRGCLWALVGAVPVVVSHGIVPAAGLAAGILVAAVALSWRTGQAPVGAGLAAGALVGLAAGRLIDGGEALLLGTLTGLVAGAAAMSATTARTLLLSTEAVRSPRTLAYLLVAAPLAAVVAWLAAQAIAGDVSPFEAPHARALAAAVDAVVTGEGAPLVVWGLAAGVAVQLLTGRGVLVALGLLIGPVTGLFVVIGSTARTFWEGRLLERAKKGWVLRGELGYGLLRAHVVVVAVLAGEAIAVALAGWINLL